MVRTSTTLKLQEAHMEQGLSLTSLTDRVEIAAAVWMPRLGLGTYLAAQGPDAEEEVSYGLSIGYRGIDTAAIYHNEESVGRAIKASGVPRADLFVATKVWNSDQGYEQTLAAFERSLARLGLEYVDLYLVHWPNRDKARGTWRAMEELRAGSKTRAIGVCNHLETDIEDLLSHATVPPAVDQVELHPYLQRAPLREYCRTHSITVQAWAPIMKGRAGSVPELVAIAKTHDKSPAQVSLRWLLQQGITTIPKSIHPERIAENADVFDFELSEEEMAAIDSLDRDKKMGIGPEVTARLNGLARRVRPR
jgi:diketogulonate reductase-like aldo/keto reductase